MKYHQPSLDIQVTTSSSAHWAVASELADNSKASKQGWGQTKIGQVLQAKVSCTHERIRGILSVVSRRLPPTLNSLQSSQVS